ncbi:LSU ribosomal protein L18P [Keratinibaculum paraultunense]|uniref:Large ribosomal subunit protein uL18 n=1 Tax=Keratinibaculum paraultunense TaxID=1278232 RepID=A0A4R3KQC7_9FIRM|nr:50S ribosomal protein L18 [Keratinibaculum paraultunense]QQY79399.1 50S ribosomal protein L18 [Keratinibaculum paraultunense]TCS86146.1 LSU ribosomal protein L18P [Keratinibaculum paraultunense]
MLKKINRNEARKIRHARVRKKIYGTPERPRLNVYRSNSHIYAQIIDDTNGHTLISASTLDKELKEKLSSTGNKEAARLVGELIGKRALEKGIEQVVFDRGGYKYHGRVKELAEGAREAGLKF